MVDRSASDRERAGSNPASGFSGANPGYAHYQIARSLATAAEHPDPSIREKAASRAQKWQSVFQKMLSGSLAVGSRTPVNGIPPWVTLEVLTGGFATGRMLAGGPVQDHEKALAAKHAIQIREDDRRAM